MSNSEVIITSKWWYRVLMHYLYLTIIHIIIFLIALLFGRPVENLINTFITSLLTLIIVIPIFTISKNRFIRITEREIEGTSYFGKFVAIPKGDIDPKPLKQSIWEKMFLISKIIGINGQTILFNRLDFTRQQCSAIEQAIMAIVNDQER